MKNRYSVAPTVWEAWNKKERRAFVDLYEAMIEDPDFYTSADTPDSQDWDPDEANRWETIAYNAALMSANLMNYNRTFG